MVPDSSEHREALGKLAWLFMELFEADSLRRWVRRGISAQIVHELPGEVVSHAQVCHELARVLAQRGEVTAELFDQLLAERPGRYPDIEAVRSLWGLPRSGLLPDGPPPVGPARHGVGEGSAARALVWRSRCRTSWLLASVAAVGWMLPRAYPKLDVSVALMAAEKSVFGFLPAGYQRYALLGIMVMGIVCAGTFWGMAAYMRRKRA